MTARLWSVTANGQLAGQFEERQLVRWVSEGRVSPTDLFWTMGMTAPAPAATVDPFASYFGRPMGLGDDRSMRALLPVGRAPWAIVAGYLGLFSILLVVGPFAILAGVVALRQIKADSRLHGKGRAIFGIVAGAIATVILVALILGH